MFYFRTRRGRIIAFAMAIIMAFTIYGGLGTASVMALNQPDQPAAAQDVGTDGDATIDGQEQVVEEDVDEIVNRGEGVVQDGNPAPPPAAIAEGVLQLASVEVLTSPEFQSLYRQSLFQGSEENGLDPEKWYTTETTINLRDPRLFTFEFSVDATTVGEDPDAFLETVDLEYGGHNLTEWRNKLNVNGSKNTLRDPDGEQYLILKDKAIVKNAANGYNVTLTMETKKPWAAKTGGTNVPYADYGGGRQLRQFSDGQSADNRWWWQTTPTKKGLGMYDMTAVAGKKELAKAKMNIQQYDGGNSWIQMNEFAQSLIKALENEELSKDVFAAQETATFAKGYVAIDEEGNFVKGVRADSVWVEVSILGYGLTDNYADDNKDFNNYARYNPIWNIVVAQDEDKVHEYLTETKPAMNDDPDSLINKYKGKDDEDIDMINVYYQNNVHPDEVSGSDSEIRLIRELIAGGKKGQDIDYYTWTDDDIEFRYRDPAEGYEQSEEGHQVKGGYEGRFLNKDARKEATFNTKEALDKFIFVNTICSNPDAKAGMRRTNRYAFDLNRDAVFTTMPETIALIRDIMKWDPLLLNEWHGYVQQMLIEPCTAPHDPAYDYDLLANNMQNLMYAAGEAITASTGYDNFLSPWDHYDGGDWDDGGTIYSPMFAELLGCFGYTIEFPDANSDAMDANTVVSYAMINELLHGTCDFYGGNRLNGPLEDVDGNIRPGHEGDIISSSMRQNSILSKLETKKRGIKNVDSMEADKYFIDKKPVLDKDGNPVTHEETNPYTGQTMVVTEKTDKVVGRARPKDQSGEDLSFFPDYIVIPYGDKQYNFAEGIKGINQMIKWGIKVEKTTADVEYTDPTNGEVLSIPADSYVIPMRQANRNVIFEVMSKGYDATGFADMYADIYCNLPDVRGFDSIVVYGEGVFDGKTKPQGDPILKGADIVGKKGKYVVFKSQSTDAVRFVNTLLKNDADVYMMAKTEEGIGTASDYVIRAKDLKLLKEVPNKPVLGIEGCRIEGQYLAKRPESAVLLNDPVIQFNTTRTSQSGGCLWYLLDDILGFNSLADYNGSTALREDANVILANNVNANSFQDSWVDAIKSGEAGVVFIRNAAGLGKLGAKAPKTAGSFQDVAVNGTYNVDDNLFTANYAKTGTYYARGNYYTDLPENAKVGFQTLKDGEDAFIGGFQPTDGQKDVFGDKTTIFSTTLTGDDFVKPVTALVIGQQMDYRSHYQKLLPMLATAIYAGAAGITDYPVIEDLIHWEAAANKYVVKASSTEYPIKSMTVKKDGKVIATSDEDPEEVVFSVRSTRTVKVVVEATDTKGNTTTKEFTIDPELSRDMIRGVELVLDANDSLAAGDYTQESFTALQEKIAALQELLNEESTSEEEIAAADAAIKDAQIELLYAYVNLVPVNKAAALEAEAKHAAIENLLHTMIGVYNLDYQRYTLDSLMNLSEVLADAEYVLSDLDATVAELRYANVALLTAIKNLEVDYVAADVAAKAEAIGTALTTMTAANNLDPGIYTEESFQAVKVAMDDIAALVNDEQATAEDIAEANTNLMKAMASLKRVESAAPAVAQKESALNELLKTMIGVKDLNTSIYKKSTVDKLNAVMDACELLVADDKATAEALMDANTNLLKARKSLVKKDANTMTAKANKVKKQSAKTLKKKNKTIKGAITVSNAKGTVTYAKASGNKKITVNSKTGNITLKKGLKKGTYKVKVSVAASGNDDYAGKTQFVTVKIKIKK